MYNPISQLVNYIRERKEKKYYEGAVEHAEKLHAQDGQRYYVLPVYDAKVPTLYAINRQQFRKLKSRGKVKKNTNFADLINAALYYTPYIQGDGALDEEGRKAKYRLYREYCKYIRNKKGGKK